MKIVKVHLREVRGIEENGQLTTKIFEKEFDIKDFSYSYQFQREILIQLDEGEVEDYARDWLDMIKKNEIKTPSLADFDEKEIIAHLEDSGYKVIKLHSLTDAYKVEELIKTLSI